MPTVWPARMAVSRPRGEVVLVEDLIAVHAADAVDVGIERAVIETADDHAHGMAHEGVVEAGKLPRAEVAGEHQNTLAARGCGPIVPQALGADPVERVVGGVASHTAELDQLPAQVAIDAAQDALALRNGELGHCQFEVALTHVAQAAHNAIDKPGERIREEARQRARHRAKAARHDHHQPVFESFPHR